jgi:hypothetical protein
VQVDNAGLGSSAGKRSDCSFVLLRPDTQVDVSVGSQPALRVESSRRPALEQQGVDPERTQSVHSLRDVTFVDTRLKGVVAIGVT